MERSLKIFEIVNQIAKFSLPSDQARLGRVNVLCSEASLRVLWREIPGLEPLLRILPHTTLQLQPSSVEAPPTAVLVRQLLSSSISVD